MDTVAMDAPRVARPSLLEAAISEFGDGAGVTVFAGGSILMVDLVYRRLAPERVLMLDRANMSGRAHRGGAHHDRGDDHRGRARRRRPSRWARALEGSPTRRSEPRPRSAATCARRPVAENPRGDLQGSLIALGAQVRSVGDGGERTEPVEEFLAHGTSGRLVLDVSFEAPSAGASASVRRPHAHSYTVLVGERSTHRRRAAAGGLRRRPACREAARGGAGPGRRRRARSRGQPSARGRDAYRTTPWPRRGTASRRCRSW